MYNENNVFWNLSNLNEDEYRQPKRGGIAQFVSYESEISETNMHSNRL